MPDEKGLFEGLADFSFQQAIAPRIIRMLYGIAILAGGVSVIVLVVNGLRESPAQGLLALVFGVIGLFVWVLYVRLALEICTAVLRMAANIEHLTSGRNP